MELPKDKKIILFDGVCNLCDGLVKKIIQHDKADVFRFVALQSELGMEIQTYLGIDFSKTNSIILYEPNKAYYTKAEAALEIAKTLGGIYNLATILNIFPKSLQNIGYDLVAKNRYRWYGKQEDCLLPSSEIKHKFL